MEPVQIIYMCTNKLRGRFFPVKPWSDWSVPKVKRPGSPSVIVTTRLVLYHGWRVFHPQILGILLPLIRKGHIDGLLFAKRATESKPPLDTRPASEE